MPMSSEALDALFTYHPPTDFQIPRFKAIAEASRDVVGLIDVVRVADPGNVPVSYDDVNHVLRALAEAIDQNAPDCANKTASLRCVQLVRNALNEALSHHHSVVGRQPLILIAEADLYRAKWQANSAIALEGK